MVELVSPVSGGRGCGVQLTALQLCHHAVVQTLADHRVHEQRGQSSNPFVKLKYVQIR